MRYELTWPGKDEARAAAELPPSGALVPDAPLADSENVFVEGDNLEVMRLLLPAYRGRVHRVLIDPPYNTGRQFVYDDDYSEPLSDYLGRSEQDWAATSERAGRFHARWLSMMLPRLTLVRELMHPEGLLFVHIDEHELHNLLHLLDEVFGEDNRLAVLTWRGMHTVRNSARGFNKNVEFIACYARDAERYLEGGPIRVPRDKSAGYPHDDGDGKGPYKLDPLHARNAYTRYTHTFDDGTTWEAPPGRYPAYSQQTLRRLEADGELDFRGKEPRIKRYLARVQQGVPPSTLLDPKEVGFAKDGTQELAGLFDGEKVFDQPKPTKLLRYLMSIGRPRDAEREELVLDCFGGSGSTGHAVVGTRHRYMLVQLPGLAEVTRKRLRKLGPVRCFRLTDTPDELWATALAHGVPLDAAHTTTDVDGDTLHRLGQLAATFPERMTEALWAAMLESGASVLVAPSEAFPDDTLLDARADAACRGQALHLS